jgi:hypothetical protein
MVAHLPVASRAALEVNERRTGLVACHEIRPHSTIPHAVAALLFAQIVAFFKIGQIRKFNLNDCRVVKHKACLGPGCSAPSFSAPLRFGRTTRGEDWSALHYLCKYA